ncbi:MAG TPA: DUF1549 domain-containing protein [Lacipirellulaceae bacterium]|nr:DUF1549 domain-containing protein [Lacipirellulaceae bacterium]
MNIFRRKREDIRIECAVRVAVMAICFLIAHLVSNRSQAEERPLALLPRAAELDGIHSNQQLILEELVDSTAAGECIEKATYISSDDHIATVDAAGVVHAVANGAATITAKAGDRTAACAITVVGAENDLRRSFRNDVQPVLAKMGCSMGACHGALAGKGGFKLSLRGYDAAADFQAITRAADGRRVEPSDPGRSLILLKPTMTVPHKGGLRFDDESPAYAILSQWIAEGCKPPEDRDRRIDEIVVFPDVVTLRPQDKQRIVVRAKYSDGRTRDVTQWAKFAATNEAVAAVADNGQITCNGHGGGAVSVWYSSKIATVRITSPYENEIPATVYQDAKHRNFIDDLVLKQLAVLHLPPAQPVSDATFLRRVFLDTIGKLPTTVEVRAFLSDQTPDKRDRLIDELLARDEYVDYWAYQWSDLLLVNGTRLRPAAVKAYYTWIHDQVKANTPWDKFAQQIVLAKGSSVENGATNFYALHQDPEDMSENICQAFLGLSIGCAKCHNHPLEKWTNDQYYAMANMFARVHAKGWGGEGRNGDGVRTVFVSSRGDLIQPSKGVPQAPTPLDGKPLPLDSEKDRREELAKWLTSPDNPYFARAITNRVWAKYFGVGIVDPVDDLRLSNPASNEELLKEATKFLVDHDYDLKSLMRAILQSNTYQASSQPDKASRDDARYYSHFYPRRLTAEVALDAISQVSAEPTEFAQIEFPGADVEKTTFYPKGTRALQLYDSAVASRFLRTFGRNQRAITCECERSNEPSLVQALHISNGDTIRGKLAAKDGKVESLSKSDQPLYRVIEELYLSALSRYPTDEEVAKLIAATSDRATSARRECIEDLFWAVLSSREFMFNH